MDICFVYTGAYHLAAVSSLTLLDAFLQGYSLQEAYVSLWCEEDCPGLRWTWKMYRTVLRSALPFELGHWWPMRPNSHPLPSSSLTERRPKRESRRSKNMSIKQQFQKSHWGEWPSDIVLQVRSFFLSFQQSEGFMECQLIASEKAMAPTSVPLAWKIPWTEDW